MHGWLIVQTERLVGDSGCLLDGDRPDHLLDFRNMVRRHAQLFQSHTQEQQGVNRFAAHFAADVDFHLVFLGCVDHQFDQSQHRRITRAI